MEGKLKFVPLDQARTDILQVIGPSLNPENKHAQTLDIWYPWPF